MAANEIAHFIPYLGTARGGPVIGLAGYVNFLADSSFALTVYSSLSSADGDPVKLDSKVKQVLEVEANWGSFRHSPALWRHALTARMDLVHSHGLWTDVHRLAGSLARGRGLPHLLAPCGMLALGALQRHWWKKVPVKLWFQQRMLREAKCLHAKSSKEYEDLRRLGLRNPIAIIGNPIARPTDSIKMSSEQFRQAHSITESKHILLFLGRLHPVKGLPRLLQAWSALHKFHSTWTLVLAGPGEAAHRREYESFASTLCCRGSVVFTGELDATRKWTALSAADLFVMPSDFENFGNSIVEALLSGIPVITTTSTPWEMLPAEGAGWFVEPDVEAVTAALRNALGLPDDKRKNMGRRAAAFSRRFGVQQAGEDLIKVYEWLLGCGARPDCVRAD
jgi:glycosyltransferase involved in cell wall biosynthesis